MNREIKFRVWDNVDYMSSPFTLEDLQLKKVQFTSDCKIMQFTGLLDAKGVEIYEGDIYRDEISIDDENGIDEIIYCVCVFFKQTASFSWITTAEYELNPSGEYWDEDEEYPNTLNGDEMHTIKIIGNIYENPELLQLACKEIKEMNQ